MLRPGRENRFREIEILHGERRKASIDKAEREQMKKFAAQKNPNFVEVAAFLERHGFKSEKKHAE